MCGEVSEGILFLRLTPHPYPYIDPSGKGGLCYKSVREKLLKKFGIAVPKPGFKVVRKIRGSEVLRR
jgi:hypothetical protein